MRGSEAVLQCTMTLTKIDPAVLSARAQLYLELKNTSEDLHITLAQFIPLFESKFKCHWNRGSNSITFNSPAAYAFFLLKFDTVTWTQYIWPHKQWLMLGVLFGISSELSRDQKFTNIFVRNITAISITANSMLYSNTLQRIRFFYSNTPNDSDTLLFTSNDACSKCVSCRTRGS